MRKVTYKVLDTEMDELIGGYVRETVEDAAYELNKSICQLVQTDDGSFEYSDPMPERYKPVKVILEDLE